MRNAPSAPPAALEKRPQPGRLRAVILAVLVHGAFFALIVFGVAWQSSPTAPLQAEIWDKLPATPKKSPAPEPQVKPEPPKPEPPKPEPPKPEPPKPEPPKPEPPKPEPPKAEPKPEPPKPDPAIAEKAERLKKEKLEREKQEKLEKQKKEEQARKKREQEEAAKKKEEQERARQEKERQAAEQRAREEAAKARASEIDAYKARITKKIRDRANIPDTVTGNPAPVFLIRVLPGGEVLDITLTRPSGNRAYDAAIERAIRSASPLPVPAANSELFPQFRELNLEFRHER